MCNPLLCEDSSDFVVFMEDSFIWSFLRRLLAFLNYLG